MKKALVEFLEMLEFDPAEIERLYPDWEAGVLMLGFTEEDVRFAFREWIPKHWDISLKGVRLCIGAYFRELIEMFKISDYRKQGVKIVYGISPSQAVCFRAVKLAGGEKVFVGYPDFVLSILLGAFFNKLSIFSDDDSLLSERCRHCALNRTRINSTMNRVIPPPDIIWTWRVFCDEAAKTEELIHCITDKGWDYTVSGVPHDAYWGEHEDEDPERVAYLAAQLRDGHERIQAGTGIELCDRHMYAALKEYSNYTRKLDLLTRLITNSDPQPLGGNELALFGTTISLTFNSGLGYFEEALDCMLEEAQGADRLRRGHPPQRLAQARMPFHAPLRTLGRQAVQGKRNRRIIQQPCVVF